MTRAPDVEEALARMVEGLKPLLARDPLMVGIHSGGVWVAEVLHKRLGFKTPLGTLDISFYRDDFTRIGLNPQVRASDLPVDVEDRHVVLVDDVLHTGRTIRAALNEIFDFGRPASVTLACLIEREGRELPIEAVVVGAHVALAPGEHIKLVKSPKLELKIQEART